MFSRILDSPNSNPYAFFIKLTFLVFLIIMNNIPQFLDHSRVIIIEGDDEAINEKDQAAPEQYYEVGLG